MTMSKEDDKKTNKRITIKTRGGGGSLVKTNVGAEGEWVTVWIRNAWVNITPVQLTPVTHSHFSASEDHHWLYLDMFRRLSRGWQASTSAAPRRRGTMWLCQIRHSKQRMSNVLKILHPALCSRRFRRIQINLMHTCLNRHTESHGC